MSKSQVSRICAGLDERVEVFRNRPLEGAYPYVWLDARIERVRDMASGMVRQKALLVAYGAHETGRREVIGLAVGEVESEAEWRGFLRGLVARGLSGVRLAISDAHAGLRAAIGQVLGAQWQRCSVHSSETCSATCPARPSRWSEALSSRSSPRPTATPPARRWRRWSTSSKPPPTKSRACSPTPRKSCWPTCASHASTGPR